MRKKIGFAITHRENGKWGEPIPLQIEGVGDLGDSYYAYITPDNRRLLIAYSTDTLNTDNLDIYICTSLSNDLIKWSAPVDPGMAINTPHFEGAPFMAADNRTLYFASSGRAGSGGSDLFSTHRLDNTWKTWSDPVNLGPTVNTPMFDASVAIPVRGDSIYVSGSAFGNEITYGRSDIFRMKLPDAFRPAPVAIVSGRLLGGARPVEGLVRVARKSDGKEVYSTTSDAHGEFTLIIPLHEEVRIIGWSKGYNETTVEIITNEEVQNNVTIVLSKEGESPTQGNVYRKAPVILFATGSATLSSAAQAQLKRYLPELRRQTGGVIAITGHTDSVGAEDNNRELSLQRAESIRMWLMAEGIQGERIKTAGEGESTPRRATKRRRDGRRTAVRRFRLRRQSPPSRCDPER